MSRKYKKVPDLGVKGKHLKGVGKVKLNGDAVEISGFANKLVVDRGRDIIEADAWELDNFKKNPVILFNHGMDPILGSTPIGVATEVKPTEKGLFVRVRLSQLDDPVINRIRGLVQERILRAFSVGFEQKDAEGEQGSDVSRIKKAELFEISIVGVPMNQDSLFELSSKMLISKSVFQLKGEILKKKGAKLASAVHARIHEMMEDGHKRSELMSELAESTGLAGDELMNVLAGETSKVDEEVLEGMAETLGMELSDLKSFDEIDRKVEGGGGEADETEETDESEDSEPEETEAPEIDLTDEAEALESDSEDNEEDKEMADEGDDDEEMKFTSDYASKVNQSIIDNFDEAVENDDILAAEVNRIAQKSDSVKYTSEDFKLWLKTLDKLRGEKQEEAPTTAIAAANTETENNDFGNPQLDMQKQTNVLLGALINEIQLMSRKLDVLSSPAEPEKVMDDDDEKTGMSDEEGEDEKLQKTRQSELDGYAKRLDAVIKRFDSLSLND